MAKNLVSKIGKILAGVTLVGFLGCNTLPKNDYFYKIYRKHGAIYGQAGAITYLLNDEGMPISKGFHEIEKTDGGYVAELGACDYVLDKQGNIISASSPECLEILPDYYEILKREEESKNKYWNIK